MSFVAFLVVVVTIVAVSTPAIGQVVNITSDLSDVGRNFSCLDEVVTYSCRGTGDVFFVNALPVFNHVFTSAASIPDAVTFSAAPNVALVLRSGIPNYVAEVQIRVLNDTQQMRLNVTCRTDRGNSTNTLPLLLESQIKPPSTVKSNSTVICNGVDGSMTDQSVNISWTLPVNTQFDIDYYIVRIYLDGVLYTTRSSRDNGLDVEMPIGVVTADVCTVSTCGSISSARESKNSFSGICPAFYAAFLIPTLIGVLLIIVIVILAIFLGRATWKMQQQVQDHETGIDLELPI